MTDALRNEVSITLGGKEYTMRATFGAIRAIEHELGKGIVAAVASVVDLTVVQTVGVIYHGIKAHSPEEPITIDEIGALVMTDGVENATGAVLKFMLQIMQGVSTPGKPVEKVTA